MVDIDHPIQLEPDFLEGCRLDPVPRWFLTLCQAILQRALDDISERKEQRDFRSAVVYIFRDDFDYPLSFRNGCSLLNFFPVEIRRAVYDKSKV
jgi:hypothetical protein